MFTHITDFTTHVSTLVCVMQVVAWAFFLAPGDGGASPSDRARRAVFTIFISLAGLLSSIVVILLLVVYVLGAP